ncbi:MAG: hypothetical protein ABI986_10105 [Chloroflexota bacterium]
MTTPTPQDTYYVCSGTHIKSPTTVANAEKSIGVHLATSFAEVYTLTSAQGCTNWKVLVPLGYTPPTSK